MYQPYHTFAQTHRIHIAFELFLHCILLLLNQKWNQSKVETKQTNIQRNGNWECEWEKQKKNRNRSFLLLML
jgi:hypothetical protein